MPEPLPAAQASADPRRFQADLLAVCGIFRVSHSARPCGAVSSRRVSGFDLASVATNARAIERDARDVRRDHDPYYFLIQQLRGHAHMWHRDRRADVGPGDYFLVSSTRPALFRYDGLSIQASLHLPRATMTEAFGPHPGAGLHLRAGSVMARALNRAVCKLGDNPDEIVELLAIAARDAEDRDLDLTDLALRLIERRAADPGLTPAALAGALDVSLRGLQRALAAKGISATAAIQDQRMHCVRALLHSRPDMTVAACAQAAGFPDISRFTRDFRARYGCPPGQYRSLPA
ncbi:helix-turn-helix domain-containing protein [Paracoccus xiamenensis]|uniref:helix-turn-helix domain-containing protein n=1 Tax=Paracoccus xiamenensis TaxID=2714901 RepID=UPI00140B0002|nr:helix-turn-helix domain-containing protein [Paracoccus xiamenensis]NHF72886.1 helix-turn-helix domain-containing protein [Paracoccus xiamenensis]